MEWLVGGDQSTTFFARAMINGNAKNSLMRTMDEEGRQMSSLAMMKDRVVTHFTTLYSSSPHLRPTLDHSMFHDPIRFEMLPGCIGIQPLMRSNQFC